MYSTSTSTTTTHTKRTLTSLDKHRSDVPEAITSCQLSILPLPSDFEPSEFDVMCGRGRGNYNASGNLRFRELVRQAMDCYTRQKTKTAKTAVLQQIADRVRAQHGARFVKQQDDGVWVELGHVAAREKVGHAMREALSTRRKQQKAAAAAAAAGGEASTSSNKKAAPKTTTRKRKVTNDLNRLDQLPTLSLHDLPPSRQGLVAEPPCKKACTLYTTLSAADHLVSLASDSDSSSNTFSTTTTTATTHSSLESALDMAAAAASDTSTSSLWDTTPTTIEARRASFVFGRHVASLEPQAQAVVNDPHTSLGELVDHTQAPTTSTATTTTTTATGTTSREHSLMTMSFLGSFEWSGVVSCCSG